MATIEMARSLYEQGKYEEIPKVCSELIASGNNVQEARIIWAKAYIQVMGPTTPEPSEQDERLKEQYYTLVMTIAKEADTLEELFEVEYDFIITLKNRLVSSTKEFADNILKKSIIYDWRCYIASDGYFSVMPRETREKFSEYGIKRYADDRGVSVDYLRSKKQPEYENYPKDDFDYYKDDPDCTEIIFKCADQLFEKAKAMHTENYECSPDVAEEIVDAVVISYLQYFFLYLNDSAYAKFYAEKWKLMILKREAEVLDWLLQTTIHYDGKTISLCPDHRRERPYSGLMDAYKMILELDPDFVMPELPFMLAVSIDDKAANRKKSSGKLNVGQFVWAILNLLACCTPLGILALIFTITAKDAPTEEEEAKKLKTAKTCNLIGTIGGMVVIILYMVVVMAESGL